MAGKVCARRASIVCLWCAFKKLIRNVSPRSVVKCSSFRLKGHKNTPQPVRISPLVGWPYCAEVTPHIGQALRPKTPSIVPRWCLTADRHLRAFYCEFGNLCAGWCLIYSPNSLSDVSLCSTDANSVRCSCKISPNLKKGGNAARIFRIWYKSHSAAFLCDKSGFRERWFVAWRYLVVWWVWELISLCVCSRLSKKTAKRCENFCSLILKSISCVETKPEKLLRRSLFAVASLSYCKTTLLLPTPMAVSQLYASIAEHGH